ncbi:unnamed protein product [Prorocentrum cordatum]|uniref:DUF4326 domain-containing protein n=1 Tax=Prorocentrum cordatum TaxID=2364126 RepID=A0ABN9XRX7_9DINO|nr:unnamed protein product [Polarella glacialis]
MPWRTWSEVPPTPPEDAPDFFLEVFGGQANATHELMHRRVPCLPPVDLEATLGHESTDVSDVTVLDKIRQWTRAKKLHLVYPQSLSRKIAEFIWRDFAGVRGRVNLKHVDAMTADHVYVGRDCQSARARGLRGSIWANPFKVGHSSSREACVEKYRRFLLQQPGLLRQLPTLRGKILVCHCDADVPCHADVLLELLEQGNHSDGQIVQFQAFFGLKTASRKRKVGEPVRWPDSKRRKSGHVAVGAWYQQRLGLVPPIFPVDLEPGEAILRALAVQHPFDVDVSLTDAEQQCVKRLVSGTAGKFQATAHEFWKQRATELKERSLDEIYNIPDPFIRNLFLKNTRARRRDVQLGDFVHLALYRELAAAANVSDSSYIDEFAHGLPVIGTVRPSGRWPPLDEVVAPAISEAELRERAWELQDKIARRVSRQKNPELRKALWDDALADRERGQCIGPFLTKKEVSEVVGTSAWVPTERFGLWQKGKTRGIDNAAGGAGSQLNLATAATEKLRLPSTDANVGLLKILHEKLGHRQVGGWVLDESAAYRQVPVAPRHRRFAVIAMAEPDTGEVAYFVMIGHSSGLVSAVYNYNRRAAIITDVLIVVFGMLARNYYDDKFGFTHKHLAAQESDIVADVHRWLGVEYSKRKLQRGQNIVILGIRYDLQEQTLEVTEQRRRELQAAVGEAVATDCLTPAFAGKLKGRLEHVASHLWGRFGRSFLRALAERQWQRGGDHSLNRALRRSLQFWLWLLETRGVPRSLVKQGRLQSDVVIFTDGFFPDPRDDACDQQPRVGWLVLNTSSGAASVGKWEVPQSLMRRWLPRKTQIVMVEAFAAVLVVDQYRHELAGKRALLFIDSDAVLASLIKGYSAKEDLCELVGFFWRRCAASRIAVY